MQSKDFDKWNKQKKKFNRNVLWILPLTRSDKKNRYYIPITVGGANSAVILSQLEMGSATILLIGRREPRPLLPFFYPKNPAGHSFNALTQFKPHKQKPAPLSTSLSLRYSVKIGM